MRTIRSARCRPDSIWTSFSSRARASASKADDSWLSWRKTFIQSDKILKLWERYGFARIRKAAIRKCEHWMLERMKHADGLGAIYPPMQYSIMALDVLGYPADHPVRVEAIRQFDSLMVDDGKTLFFQPCFSPVWDTAIGAYALGEAGYGDAPALDTSGRLAARARNPAQRRLVGQAALYRTFRLGLRISERLVSGYRRHRHGACWRFRTCALRIRARSRPRRQRALDWLLAMQSKDGGWAAFDVDNNWEILTHVPFADHNAMLDPTCADITGRTLEALAANGFDRSHPACRRAIDYLIAHAAGRWKLVRPLGRRLYLRNLFRAARPARHGRRRSRASHPARQRMAAFHSECRWRLGRKLRQLR